VNDLHVFNSLEINLIAVAVVVMLDLQVALY